MSFVILPSTFGLPLLWVKPSALDAVHDSVGGSDEESQTTKAKIVDAPKSSKAPSITQSSIFSEKSLVKSERRRDL